MKTRCPGCGMTLSLDALVAHEGARRALAAAFHISGAIGSALVRYLALHRPQSRELTLDRVERLLNDVLPDVQAQRIMRGGQLFDAPHEAWIWAIEQALAARDAGRLKTPLKGHGWLYEVISHWQPDCTTATAALMPASRRSLKPVSKTLSAIAALEDRARG